MSKNFEIYFCGSIRGGRQDAELYARIIKKLTAYGEVMTEHVGDTELTERYMSRMDDKEIHELDMKWLSRSQAPKDITDEYIHDRDVKWLEMSDAVVAEVTQPSLGVGYEIGRAVAMKKKILCLYRPSADKSLSAMIRGAENDEDFFVKDYKEVEVDDILKEFFEKIEPKKDA